METLDIFLQDGTELDFFSFIQEELNSISCEDDDREAKISAIEEMLKDGFDTGG